MEKQGGNTHDSDPNFPTAPLLLTPSQLQPPNPDLQAQEEVMWKLAGENWSHTELCVLPGALRPQEQVVP